MEVDIEGFNEASGFSWKMRADGPYSGDILPNKYFTLTYGVRHNIQIKQIPGKNKGDLTMRTSDVKTASTGPLYTGSMSVYCTTQTEFEKCKQFADLGGPYKIIHAFGDLKIYVSTAEFSQDSGFMEPGTSLNDDSFFCTWTYNLIEYRDGP